MKAWSLRAKLMLLIALAVLPLAALQLNSAREARVRAEVRVGADTMRLSHLVAGQQRAILESAQQLMITLAQVPLESRMADANRFLAKLLALNPSCRNIGILDREGVLIASGLELPGPVAVSERAYFQNLREGAKNGDGGRWRVLSVRAAHDLVGGPSLVLAYPLRDDKGAFDGAIFVGLGIQSAQELGVMLPENVVVDVIDSDARILVHFPDPERWVGRRVESRGLLEAILTTGSDEGWITINEDGVERIYAVVPLRLSSGGRPLFVSVGVDRESAFAPYRAALRRQAWWTVAVVASALGSAWLVGSLFIVRPARHLVAAARAVSRRKSANGAIRSRLPDCMGEFYEIGNAMNQMADAADEQINTLHAVQDELQKAHDTLESRVERRTEELRRARERLVDAIENLDAAFVMFDQKERLRICNEPFRKVFSNCNELIRPGITFEEILTAFFQRGGEVENVGDSKAWIRDRMRLFRKAAGETLLARINGRWILVSDHRMRDGGVVSLRTDVTERVEAHLAVEKAAAELQRSNEELEQFAYTASHDLQEPLRMVASYTQLLARRYKDQLDSDAQEFIGYAVDGARRMQEFIEDLLKYSRASKRRIVLQPIRSGEMVQRAMDNLRYSLEEKGGIVDVGDLPEIMGDRLQLVQLFQNLIGNAIKFSGPEPLKVTIEAQPAGEGEWVFSVKDNGLGLDEEDRERAFVMFQRLHAGENEVEGTGIGLPICKKIVERHGGKIWVESRKGEGATFYFTLRSVPEATAGEL